MNVNLKVLGVGALFFLGGGVVLAQKKDTVTKTRDIDEVVILGYGKVATKAKSTTSSTTISADKLENRASTSFISSVAGTAPGIAVNTSSGSPGSGKIDVRVRGVSSLNSSTDPLYVIDGLMSSSTEFRNLNQNDIETLSILRDAQATAIYGNHGANGVVVITTKSGSFNSGVRVSYDAVTNFSMLPNHNYDLVNSSELLKIQARAGVGIGGALTSGTSAAAVANRAAIEAGDVSRFVGVLYGYDPTQETDWSKVFTRVGVSQQHNIGIRSGGEGLSSYTSLGYLSSEGVIRNTDFQRFTARTNINGRSKDRKFVYSTQIGLGYSKRHQLDEETNSDISNNTIQNPLIGVVTGQPTWRSGMFTDGRDAYDKMRGNFSQGRTIYVLEDVLNGGIRKRYTQTSIMANANAQYEILDGLKIGNKTGVVYKNNALTFARTPNGYLSVAVATQNKADYGGFETFQDIVDVTINSVTSVMYDKKYGDHTLGVAGYLDYLRGFYSINTSTRNGLDPLSWAFGAGTGYIPFSTTTPNLYLPSASAGKVVAGTLAYIGTVDYDFASKYGFSATIRRDGSYRFADGNKWETFWSVAGRWNIDKEEFMQGSWFNMLKLRASYGTNGNQNVIPASGNANPLFLGANLVRDVYSTTTGYNNAPSWITYLQNSELQWEKIKQANIGLDFGLFRNKVEGNIDVYEKTTTDMYLTVPISGINGAYTISGNNGTMRNRGVEASLKFTPIRNRDGLTLSAFANFAYNQNRIMELPSEDLSGTLVNAIGGPAYQWKLYEYVGVNKTNGNAQYRAKDGSITEKPTAEDRLLTGKSVYAPYTGGFGLEVDYKGFYLTSLFSFQKGGWSQDSMLNWQNRGSYSDSQRVSRGLLNAWSSTNTDSDIPALTSDESLMSGSDRFLMKTDFIKLKNLSVGYNFNKKQLQGMPVKAIKVYAMGENLLTFTDWKGFDPEPIKGSSLGVYPNVITYSIGMNVEF